MIEPIFEPDYLSLEWVFYQIVQIAKAIYRFILSEAFVIVLVIAGVLFILFIIFFIARLNRIRAKEKREYKKVLVVKPSPTKRNERWQRVLAHLDSPNLSDWKLAIIEADAMLDEITKKMGYRGENLGERLKQVERSDFSTIDEAWQAHRIRNRIAHEGTSFQISKEQARQVIGLYEKVFKEFNYV